MTGMTRYPNREEQPFERDLFMEPELRAYLVDGTPIDVSVFQAIASNPDKLANQMYFVGEEIDIYSVPDFQGFHQRVGKMSKLALSATHLGYTDRGTSSIDLSQPATMKRAMPAPYTASSS
jgi:hypothetical protein